MIVADVRLSGVDRDVWRAYVKPMRRRLQPGTAPPTGDNFTPVRPDGYIGLTCRRPERVRQYLREITTADSVAS